MRSKQDPVDRALEALAGPRWPGAGPRAEMENRLMQAFDANMAKPQRRSRRCVIPAVGLLLLGGTVFVAAGGISLVKSWFVTIQVNGQLVHTGDVTFDENGEATIILPEDARPADGVMTVGLSGTEQFTDAGQGPQMRTLTITAGDDQVRVFVGSQPPPETEPAEAPDAPGTVSLGLRLAPPKTEPTADPNAAPEPEPAAEPEDEPAGQ